MVVGPGCEADPTPTSTPRDSLGITIVESSAPRWAEGDGWRITEEPVVDLAETGAGDMHSFYLVGDVLRVGGDQAREGGDYLVVADRGSREVRIYDSGGGFVRAFGGDGDGPGEFRYLSGLILLRDGRLVAQDFAAGGRGAVFDIDSGLTATFRRPQMASPLRQPAPSDVVWGLDAGLALVPEGLEPGFQRPLATILRLSEDRMSGDSVATVPGNEVFVVPETDVIPVMGRLTHVVPTGNGELVLGTADALEYSRLDARTGEIRSIVRILGVSLAVSKSEFDREKQVKLGPDPNPFVLDLLARMPVPAERPAYQRLIVDVEGNVWAGEFLGLARRYEPQQWYVWDSSGVWLGIVATPARFELMRVGADEVFGVRLDMNDVEHPQVLRLDKGD